jgi:hypothetical protein
MMCSSSAVNLDQQLIGEREPTPKADIAVKDFDLRHPAARNRGAAVVRANENLAPTTRTLDFDSCNQPRSADRTVVDPAADEKPSQASRGLLTQSPEAVRSVTERPAQLHVDGRVPAGPRWPGFWSHFGDQSTRRC